jgi:hypothetical protein
MFARIENNSVAAYPVDPQIEQPATSFPWDWPGGVVNGVEYVRVVPVDVPQVLSTQNFAEGTPVFADCVWTQTWVITEATPDQIAARKIEMRQRMSVTPLQIRRALRQRGLLSLVTEFVNAAEEEVREAWEYAIQINRTNSLIIAAAEAIGASDDDVDELFRIAATL